MDAVLNGLIVLVVLGVVAVIAVGQRVVIAPKRHLVGYQPKPYTGTWRPPPGRLQYYTVFVARDTLKRALDVIEDDLDAWIASNALEDGTYPDPADKQTHDELDGLVREIKQALEAA